MQDNTVPYKDSATSRRTTKCSVGMSVLMMVGFCVCGTTGTMGGNGQGGYQIILPESDTSSIHLSPRLGPELGEQEAVRLIHSVLGEYYTGLRDEEEERLARFIYQEGNKQGLDPFLLVAVIRVESTFDNFSESYMGAKGLMQILPSVGRSMAEEAEVEWEGDRTLFNPRKNIRIGASYLKKLVQQFNDIHLALAAYNLGPTALKNHIRSGRRVSSLYTERVMLFYEDLQKRTRKGTV